MATFFIGLSILIVGGFFYGKLCERAMKPDKNKITPAFLKNDGVDFVPMPKWKTGLIELLNIAGTGPILGPIQGILFGPIAFLTIPIGCIIGGAAHDYMSGMLALKEGGEQMPGIIKKYLGRANYWVYVIFVCVLMVLVGAVFIYTPGDIFVGQVLDADISVSNPVVWIVFAVIFGYYIIATLFPIDKIIGKIYPIFGGILLLSAAGVFIGMFVKGYKLDEVWTTGLVGVHPDGLHFIPIFFVTVACGIVSGFHSTQAAMISRTLKNERDGKSTFYYMMIIEGFIAMTWAAAAMGAFNNGVSTATSPTAVVGIIAKDLLGPVGGIIAMLGVIVLAITSGDTALRSLRLMAGDFLKLDQSKRKNRLGISLVIFALVAGILVFAKLDAQGFNVLWRYFAWANQTISVFAFAAIAIYLMEKNPKKPFFIMALLPGMFYFFVVCSYIFNAKIGFNVPWTPAYIVSGVLTAVYGILTFFAGRRRAKRPNPMIINGFNLEDYPDCLV